MILTCIPGTPYSASIPTTRTVDLQAAICLTLSLQVGDNTTLWVAWKSRALQRYKHSTSLRANAEGSRLRAGDLCLRYATLGGVPGARREKTHLILSCHSQILGFKPCICITSLVQLHFQRSEKEERNAGRQSKDNWEQ